MFIIYSEVATPTMNNIKVTYVGDSIDPESLTEADFPNYFDGSELIVAGKLRDNSINTITTHWGKKHNGENLDLTIFHYS